MPPRLNLIAEMSRSATTQLFVSCVFYFVAINSRSVNDCPFSWFVQCVVGRATSNLRVYCQKRGDCTKPCVMDSVDNYTKEECKRNTLCDSEHTHCKASENITMTPTWEPCLEPETPGKCSETMRVFCRKNQKVKREIIGKNISHWKSANQIYLQDGGQVIFAVLQILDRSGSSITSWYKHVDSSVSREKYVTKYWCEDEGKLLIVNEYRILSHEYGPVRITFTSALPHEWDTSRYLLKYIATSSTLISPGINTSEVILSSSSVAATAQLIETTLASNYTAPMSNPDKTTHQGILIGAVIGGGIVVLILIMTVVLILIRKRRCEDKGKQPANENAHYEDSIVDIRTVDHAYVQQICISECKTEQTLKNQNDKTDLRFELQSHEVKYSLEKQIGEEDNRLPSVSVRQRYEKNTTETVLSPDERDDYFILEEKCEPSTTDYAVICKQNKLKMCKIESIPPLRRYDTEKSADTAEYSLALPFPDSSACNDSKVSNPLSVSDASLGPHFDANCDRCDYAHIPGLERYPASKDSTYEHAVSLDSTKDENGYHEFGIRRIEKMKTDGENYGYAVYADDCERDCVTTPNV